MAVGGGKQARQERIVAELRAQPALRVSELAALFDVSTETVRRDLEELDRSKRLHRTYGGASALPYMSEPTLHERSQILVEERTRIGRAAARLVGPNEVIFIDSGSTTLACAQRLSADCQAMTAITTSVPIAAVLAANPAIHVIVCPGDYDPRDGSLHGTHTVEFIRRFSASHVFFGASALAAEGPSDANPAAVAIKQAMIERAALATLLVDHSKYERGALERICALKSIDRIVCDARLPDELATLARKHSIEIIVA